MQCYVGRNLHSWVVRYSCYNMLRYCPMLSLCSAHRALQNPRMFTNEHYRQAAMAVGVGICIRLAVAIPVGLSIHPVTEHD